MNKIKADFKSLIYLGLGLICIKNVDLIVLHCNKYIPSKDVIWSKNIIFDCYKSLLYLTKLEIYYTKVKDLLLCKIEEWEEIVS